MDRGDVGNIEQIRVLMIDTGADAPRVLEPLLSLQQAIIVVAETVELSRVPILVGKSNPHVIVLRAAGVDDAVEAIGIVLAQSPEAKLLVIAGAFTLEQAVQVFEHGAHGLLAPDDVFAQGLRAIRAVHRGEIWGSRAVLSYIVRATIKQTTAVHAHEKSSLKLTERESEIILLLRSGASNKEIASRLSISDKTVKTHLQNIFGKLKVNRRQKIFPALLA